MKFSVKCEYQRFMKWNENISIRTAEFSKYDRRLQFPTLRLHVLLMSIMRNQIEIVNPQSHEKCENVSSIQLNLARERSAAHEWTCNGWNENPWARLSHDKALNLNRTRNVKLFISYFFTLSIENKRERERKIHKNHVQECLMLFPIWAKCERKRKINSVSFSKLKYKNVVGFFWYHAIVLRRKISFTNDCSAILVSHAIEKMQRIEG